MWIFNIFIFSILFFNIEGKYQEKPLGKVVDVNDKNLGDFDVLNVNVSKGTDGEAKKVVIVNINNLKLTVDTTQGGFWVFLKSVAPNNYNYYNYRAISTSDSSSEKSVDLNTKDLSPCDTLNITITPDANSQSKKKLNLFINDKVIILDTRNFVSLCMKNSNDANSNNNVFYTYNSDGNNVNVQYHVGDGFSYSSNGDFDEEAFKKGMNQLEESMAKMRENMQGNFPWNWNWNK